MKIKKKNVYKERDKEHRDTLLKLYVGRDRISECLESLSRDHTAQLRDEYVLPCTQVEHKELHCPFQAWYWHLKRLLILCFVSFDKFSHLIGHFSPHSQYLHRLSTGILNVIAVSLFTLLATDAPLPTAEYDWSADGSVAVPLTAYSHLLNSAGPNLCPHLGCERGPYKVFSGNSGMDVPIYNPWLTVDGWDIKLNTGEWNELGSSRAYIMTTEAPNKCQLFIKKLLLMFYQTINHCFRLKR